jgi:hypothetical protein
LSSICEPNSIQSKPLGLYQTNALLSLTLTMDSNPHETRPLKRRRMDMAPPDGFTTTATTARKPVYKPVVPQFSSGFNGDRASDHTSTIKPSSSSKESTDNLKERKPVLSKSSIIERADKPKERRSVQVLHAHLPSKPDTRTFTPRTPKEWPSTFLPALHGSLISGQLKVDAPILQLRPPPKPPIMPSYHTPITTSALLKPAVPPPPLLANKHFSKDMKSLQPPVVPPPLNPAIDGKNLRTISKTRVALATDLSTDSGVAELAQIFLHDQHPEITLPNSHPDDHDGRGLGLSPEKKSKGKNPKLVRYALFSFCLGPGLYNEYIFRQRWLSSSCICVFRTVPNLSRLMAKRNGTSCKHAFILRLTRQHHQDPTKTASLRLKTNFSRHSSLSNPV